MAERGFVASGMGTRRENSKTITRGRGKSRAGTGARDARSATFFPVPAWESRGETRMNSGAASVPPAQVVLGAQALRAGPGLPRVPDSRRKASFRRVTCGALRHSRRRRHGRDMPQNWFYSGVAGAMRLVLRSVLSWEDVD